MTDSTGPTSAIRRSASTSTLPACVLRVDPLDGATGVFRDAPVLVRLSGPLDDASLTAEAFSVRDPDGPVPGSLSRVAVDLLVWNASRALRPHAIHFVLTRGLRDVAGHAIADHCSRFVCGELGFADFTD